MAKKKTLQQLMQCINTFTDVCKEAGVNEEDYRIDENNTPKQMMMAWLDRQILIAQVYNGDKELEISKRMYYPWDNKIIDDTAPRGFRLAFSDCSCDHVYAHLGARPYFIDPEACRDYGRKFEAERTELLYWTVKANNQKLIKTK